MQNHTSEPEPTSVFQFGLSALSRGAKLLVITLLALVMSLGALFISNLVNERTGRANEVLRDISTHVGGSQTFLGPTLLVPYTTASASQNQAEEHGVYVIFPAAAKAQIKTSTEERRRSLFKVPVFQAEGNLQASFDLTDVARGLSPTTALDWSRAEIVVGVSDVRGARSNVTLTIASGTRELMPATISPTLSYGKEDKKRMLHLLGSHVAEATAGAKFDVTAHLQFSGAQRIAVLPYGKSTELSIVGDWRNPGFDGSLLPTNREVNHNGFQAVWSVPFIAREIPAEGDVEKITGLDASDLGVSFVEVADPYQSVNRSLKYSPLFLGLVFLSYFVFEVTTRNHLHLGQYLLVGLAQLIFYLLLLSFAERVSFDGGFAIAAVATVLLLALNAGWVFASRTQAFRAAVIFGLLYGMIYLLLSLEDNALMIGAIGSFAAVAAAMYCTRNIDWFGTGRSPNAVETKGFVASAQFRVGEL